MLSNILGIEEGGCSLQATVTRTGEPLGKLCVSQGAGEPPKPSGRQLGGRRRRDAESGRQRPKTVRPEGNWRGNASHEAITFSSKEGESSAGNLPLTVIDDMRIIGAFR